MRDMRDEDADEAILEVSGIHFPMPVLLVRASVGTLLTVRPDTQSATPAALVMLGEEVAGAVALDAYPALYRALCEGAAYCAVLTENFGGHCRVLVRRAG